MLDDTIAAIATPLGTAGVGVIRVSGDRSLEFAYRFFPSVLTFEPRYMHVASCVDPSTNDIIDHGCCVYFKSPASFTGEDVVEFHLHSNPHILHKVLEHIVALGGRLAEAGEFTRRAFLNGKIDLTRAESVADVIHASSHKAHQISLTHLKGGLYRRMMTMRKELMRILEHVEGSMDFPDEIPPIDREATCHELNAVLAPLNDMIRLKDYGEMVHQGVKCVIIGRPNVGKSSLMNALLGESRAIVSPTAGTTRDYISVHVALAGLSVEFTDTAGIREDTGDIIERLGIKKIQSLIKRAHVVLWVLDGSHAMTEDDKRILQKLKRLQRVLVVINKSDKTQRLDLSDISLPRRFSLLSLSTKSRAGIQSLKDKMITMFLNDATGVSDDLICNARQLASVKIAIASLDHAVSSLINKFPDDVLAIDLKAAILALGEITGEAVTEEMLDGVFSRFCVGK